MAKLEFASDAWVEAADAILRRAAAAAGPAIAGERLAVSEAFENAPAHLAAPSGRAAWFFIVDNGRVQTGKGELAGADYQMSADYTASLPGARTVLGTSPDAIDARNRARREAIASGRVKASGSLDHVSPPMRQVLIELHNRLAEITA